MGGQLCEWLAVLMEVLSCPVIHARAKCLGEQHDDPLARGEEM